MEQLIVILVIVLFSFVNWLIKKAAEANQKSKLERSAQFGDEAERTPPQTASEPPPISGAGGGDESMRKLMEALGLPQDALPPPVRRQAPAPPPLPANFPQPSTAMPPVVSPVQKQAAKTPKTSLSHAPLTPLQHAPKTLPSHAPKPVPALAKSSQVEPVAEAAGRLGIRELLASPDGAKKAVILSEILGAPKGMRG